MAETRAKIAELDPVWGRITLEAEDVVSSEPLLGGLVHYSILHHPTIERALAYRISLKLANGDQEFVDGDPGDAGAGEPQLTNHLDGGVHDAGARGLGLLRAVELGAGRRGFAHGER